ncbi:hypothetical protein Ae201684P_017331 [Aphanomyces euteiches]|nr:hypothetical protein Ae201684P_017331 [Aphanomyces euteiches]
MEIGEFRVQRHPLLKSIALSARRLDTDSHGQTVLHPRRLQDFLLALCCVYGVGTLSKNYATAGFVWATLALVFMAFVNIYATVCISKLLLLAPKSVRTFADLGEFCMGKVGRFFILLT